jgi:DNA repair ATPase RecN
MPSPEEREQAEPSDSLSPAQATSRGALPVGYLDDVSRVAEIYRTLGGLDKLVDGLRTTTKSHAEKIEQLTERIYAIPHIKRDVAKNTKDLNELGERHTKELNQLGIRLGKEIGHLNNVAHTADKLLRIFLGALAVILTVLGPPLMIYLYHHVSLVFHP